jgi:hypothetical protein
MGHAAGTAPESDVDVVAEILPPCPNCGGDPPHQFEARESYGKIIDPGHLGDLAEILSQQVTRYLDSSQDVEHDETVTLTPFSEPGL